MVRFAKKFLKLPFIITAATIGEGVFALPYIFFQSGWLVSTIYLVVLGVIVAAAHVVYVKMLEQVGEKERLLGLAKKYLRPVDFWIGMFAVIIGLLLTLVAYLVLGPRFIQLAIPGISPRLAFALLWFWISVPTLVTNRRAVWLEILGVSFVLFIILFVFLNALPTANFSLAPIANAQYAFLPFGVILLSLAGWTGIEPAYESSKGLGKSKRAWGIVMGTVLAMIIYLLFVAGILGSAGQITPDTLSGITHWAAWKRIIIAILGVFAIGTGSVPLSHELRNAFEKDLKWPPLVSRLTIILLPVVVVMLGFNQFIVVLSVAGGCFIALQYLLILLVGRKLLALSCLQKLFLDSVAGVFLLAIVYEVYGFIVH